MAYEFDVFISYKRLSFWPEWVKRWFKRELEFSVAPELGRAVNVYFDSQLESGVLWPPALANALASSRVLVALFSRAYPSSQWCCAELAHMLSRERTCGMRTRENPQGLIVPALIHDGEHLPAGLYDLMQINVDLARFTSVTHEESARFEEFRETMRTWAPSIARSIEGAPSYDPGWVHLARDAFEALIAVPSPVQMTVPSLGQPSSQVMRVVEAFPVAQLQSAM